MPDFSSLSFKIFANFETKAIFTSRLETKFYKAISIIQSPYNFQAIMSEASWVCLKVNEISALARADSLYCKAPIIYSTSFTKWNL